MARTSVLGDLKSPVVVLELEKGIRVLRPLVPTPTATITEPSEPVEPYSDPDDTEAGPRCLSVLRCAASRDPDDAEVGPRSLSLLRCVAPCRQPFADGSDDDIHSGWGDSNDGDGAELVAEAPPSHHLKLGSCDGHGSEALAAGMEEASVSSQNDKLSCYGTDVPIDDVEYDESPRGIHPHCNPHVEWLVETVDALLSHQSPSAGHSSDGGRRDECSLSDTSIASCGCLASMARAEVHDCCCGGRGCCCKSVGKACGAVVEVASRPTVPEVNRPEHAGTAAQ
eukprot:gnl/TRDRNA2_/TRDRNA2_200442_c0_seq1.p1 gnl/TRDRNA2_/TRDRNA2_200442_c0~~gnl/TRDRNA2_/TRDRNA2_200442_c0_seq1.p1  ORF type:complete len:282 (+),score=23.60 gnl/TRDRNA2_/TRDRNA2_200442_c0_seq1:46-891(+)